MVKLQLDALRRGSWALDTRHHRMKSSPSRVSARTRAQHHLKRVASSAAHSSHGEVRLLVDQDGALMPTSKLTSCSNILSLPFRKTASVSLSAAIKQYISSKYDQHPDMFKQDLEVIDALRRDAIFVKEPHTSGIKKVAAYAGQLSWMGGKFPIDVSGPFRCQASC